MTTRNPIRAYLFLGVATVAVPVLMGGTCPMDMTTPPPGATTLLSEMVASSTPAPIAAANGGCVSPTNTGFTRAFNAVAGKLVTITVTGPASSSRPQIRATDLLGNQVANTGATPTSQTNTTTFTPTADQLYVLTVNECAAGFAAGSVYTVLVTQAP